MDYEHYKLKSYTQWDLYLHQNQYYLGRMYLWAKGENRNVDMTQMTPEEHTEWWQICQQIRTVLNTMFKPDRINWSWLQNEQSHDHHLHMHIVPRYESPRLFGGYRFVDEQPFANWSPYPKEMPSALAITVPTVCSKLKEAFA